MRSAQRMRVSKHVDLGRRGRAGTVENTPRITVGVGPSMGVEGSSPSSLPFSGARQCYVLASFLRVVQLRRIVPASSGLAPWC